MSFVNKVLLVTGAGSGIGAGTAIKFAKEGANVAIVGRNIDKLKRIAEKCEKIGPKPLIIQSDVSHDESASRIINEVIATFKKLDVLVNNAGVLKFGTILKGNLLEAYDTTMVVNVRAPINLTSIAAPHLVKTKGNIINISSLAGTTAPEKPPTSAYHISKAALSHFSRCAALELAKHGVRVNTISPGPVKTDLMDNAGIGHVKFDDMAKTLPLQRVSEAGEIADLIAFLASDRAVGITGSEIFVDNGYLLKHG
ncbi:unnamed protein product [Pieris macdunnoughi]|uniref:Uncharacterized protein n=1 Tax=Pieris macdunnoughi TaxID=345717 RepID=A0A821U9E1_9NEOP|nr:unnamed protein product [Pieris macdunnoughi]